MPKTELCGKGRRKKGGREMERERGGEVGKQFRFTMGLAVWADTQ